MRLFLVLLGACVYSALELTSDSEDIFNTDTVAAALSVADDMNNIFQQLNPKLQVGVQEATEEEKSVMPPSMAALSSEPFSDDASLLAEPANTTNTTITTNATVANATVANATKVEEKKEEEAEEKDEKKEDEKKEEAKAEKKGADVKKSNETAIEKAIEKEEKELEKEQAVLGKMKQEEAKEKSDKKEAKKKDKGEKVEVVKNLEAAVLADKTAKANAPKKGFATAEEELAEDQKAAIKLDEEDTKKEMHDAAFEVALKDAAEKFDEGRTVTKKDLYDPVGDDEALPASKSDKIVEMISGLQKQAATLMKEIRSARRGNTKESMLEAARLLEQYGTLKVKIHDAVMKYASPEDFMHGFPKPRVAALDELPGWTQPFAPALPPAQSMDEAKPIMRPANPRINADDTIVVYSKLKKPIVPFILPSSSVTGFKKPSLLPRIECPANKLPC